MNERERIEILRQLQEDFWRDAWSDLIRCGVGRDGHYHPPTDLDWLAMIYVARDLKEELLEFKKEFRRQCGGLPIIATRTISEPTHLNAVTIHLQASRRVGRNQKVILVTEWIVNGTRMGENAMFGRLRKLGMIED